MPWRAEADDIIVATLDVPPERPELTLRIDAQGAPRSVSMLRWGNVGRPEYGYIPFGAEIHAEARFGERTLPSRVTVGWELGTPAFKPFFEARSARPSRSDADEQPGREHQRDPGQQPGDRDRVQRPALAVAQRRRELHDHLDDRARRRSRTGTRPGWR